MTIEELKTIMTKLNDYADEIEDDFPFEAEELWGVADTLEYVIQSLSRSIRK